MSGRDERRTFRTWEAAAALAGVAADAGPVAGVTYTFNSTELRAVDIALEPVALVGEVHLSGLWLEYGALLLHEVMQRGDGYQGWRRQYRML